MFFILNFNLQNMIIKQISLALMLLLSIASCKKEETTTNTTVQRLVFGTYFGECLTNCVTIFALDSAKVQQDTLINTFIPINYVFAGVDLSNDKFEQVKKEFDKIGILELSAPSETADKFKTPANRNTHRTNYYPRQNLWLPRLPRPRRYLC